VVGSLATVLLLAQLRGSVNRSSGVVLPRRLGWVILSIGAGRGVEQIREATIGLGCGVERHLGGDNSILRNHRTY